MGQHLYSQANKTLSTMPAEFLTFQKFSDTELATTVANILRDYDIPTQLENERHFWDPSFANNAFDSEIILKIPADQFETARRVMTTHYQQSLEDVDEDYYLLSFTSNELMDIVAKPDEWGAFDYQLAQKLLKERGKEISVEKTEQLKNKRIAALRQPEHSQWFWIYFGYLSAVFGGIFGLIIGYCLSHIKKTLPNGERVYAYSAIDRKHGKQMFLISVLSIITWLIIRWKMQQ